MQNEKIKTNKHLNGENCKPNDESKSTIDYWLVSDNILRYASQTKISNAPLSDHCFIDLVLEPRLKENRHKGYWKFNAIVADMEGRRNKLINWKNII